MAQTTQLQPGLVSSSNHRIATTAWTDDQLLQQFLSLDDERAEAAFAELVERYGRIVQRVCLDVLGSADEAQDAAQAVFLVLARKSRSIRKPGSLGPWLHGVALRVSKRARSVAARQRGAERRKAQIMSEVDSGKSQSEWIDHAHLHEEIERLPEKYRQPIILFYMQGHTQEQAARALGCPLGTVQTRLHRGRERLRARLTRSGVGMLAMARLEPDNSPATSAGVARPEWVEKTARGAVRFCAGNETAGLVSSPVARLA